VDKDIIYPHPISYGMNTIQKLAEYFSKLPGIGPRQSKRFVYYLLRRDHRFNEELARLILDLKNNVYVCQSCYRFFVNGALPKKICGTCAGGNRDTNMLMIVAKDIDFENIERSGVYNGLYFILGGTIAILEKNPEHKVRSRELMKTVEKRAKNGILKEIILAFSVNPEGENTTRFVSELLDAIASKYSVRISTLARGLSTGTELEYPDAETIKSAYKNRA
jgi:recombination protein RecR